MQQAIINIMRSYIQHIRIGGRSQQITVKCNIGILNNIIYERTAFNYTRPIYYLCLDLMSAECNVC